MTCHSPIPQFPGRLRKNDALLMYGAVQPLPFVFSYVPESIEVVHGPSCRPEEIFLDCCQADGVSIFERRGGGGTVVLAPGMVVTVVVGVPTSSQGIRALFSRINRAIIFILGPLIGKKTIQEAGISDLAIDNCKILGSSLYLTAQPKRFYYQASLLVDADITLFERYLDHPSKEPDYRQGRSHAAFCTTLREQGCRLSAVDVADMIRHQLGLYLEKMGAFR